MTMASAEMKWNGMDQRRIAGSQLGNEFSNVTRSDAGKGVVRWVS
jgi:hypothetical protein